MARPSFDKEKALESFWSKVEKTDSCWNWTASKTNFGHGIFQSGKKYGLCDSFYTHRIAYNLTFDDYDSKLKVLHKCDNPSCVNPDHLFQGTQKDNIDDMTKKGRHGSKTKPEKFNGQQLIDGKKAKHEEHGRAKLNWQQVREIRDLYASGNYTQRELGGMYGVDHKNIGDIVNNKIWIEE